MFFTLLAAALMLQEPAPIRVTTRMVEIGVLVHDRNGRAVKGLHIEDFRLLDGGQEQTIRSFSIVRQDSHGTPGEARVATAILLDQFNSEFRNEAFGYGQLLRFLRTLEVSHPVALLSLENGFQVLHDFTTDSASLIRTLAQHRPYRPIQAAAFRPRRTGVPSIDSVDRAAEPYKAAMRARETGSAIAALASFLARTPGRKNLIWISSIFPAALAASVRTDDVAIYPVDVTTPITGPRPSARMLAERTGGVAFDHGNDVQRGIRMAYQDSNTVYLLGYYPSHDRWDGKFRRVQVTVNRPDLELRHRAGYVAALDDSFQPPDQRETLWYVAASPAEARGIRVSAKAEHASDGPTDLALAIDPQTLSPDITPGRPYNEELELMVVPVRSDGETLTADYRSLKLNAPVGNSASHSGLTVMHRMTPPPEARNLRIIVREKRTGALGSATVALARPKHE